MNIQDWFPLGWTGWISLQSKGLSRLFSNTTVSKASILLALSLPYGPTLTSICDYWRLGVISVKKKKKRPIWVVVQSLKSCLSLQTHGLQHSRLPYLSFTDSWSLLRLMSIELVMPSNHLIFCRPLLLLPQSLPASVSFPMSQLFSLGGQSIGVSASASVLPMNTQDCLLRMDWFDLLAAQGTLKSLLQHHSFKSINSLALSFLHSPTLTPIHDHRKNHSLD